MYEKYDSLSRLPGDFPYGQQWMIGFLICHCWQLHQNERGKYENVAWISMRCPVYKWSAAHSKHISP